MNTKFSLKKVLLTVTVIFLICSFVYLAVNISAFNSSQMKPIAAHRIYGEESSRLTENQLSFSRKGIASFGKYGFSSEFTVYNPAVIGLTLENVKHPKNVYFGIYKDSTLKDPIAECRASESMFLCENIQASKTYYIAVYTTNPLDMSSFSVLASYGERGEFIPWFDSSGEGFWYFKEGEKSSESPFFTAIDSGKTRISFENFPQGSAVQLMNDMNKPESAPFPAMYGKKDQIVCTLSAGTTYRLKITYPASQRSEQPGLIPCRITWQGPCRIEAQQKTIDRNDTPRNYAKMAPFPDLTNTGKPANTPQTCLDFLHKAHLGSKKYGFRRTLVIKEPSEIFAYISEDYPLKNISYGIYRDHALNNPIMQIHIGSNLKAEDAIEEGADPDLFPHYTQGIEKTLKPGTYYLAAFTNNPNDTPEAAWTCVISTNRKP